MQSDEQCIIDYLKGWPGAYVSTKEIARKACGKKRFEADAEWAAPLLMEMVRRGILETDHLGHYRLPLETRKKERPEIHVAPQILKILKSSGRSFEGITLDDDIPAESNAPAFPADPKRRAAKAEPPPFNPKKSN